MNENDAGRKLAIALLDEHWKEQEATVKLMATAAATMGAEMPVEQFPADPVRAMEWLIKEELYETRGRHDGSARYHREAYPADGLVGPLFRSCTVAGWVLLPQEGA